MITSKNKKIIFLHGFGEQKGYKELFPYFNVPKIDWNKGTISPPLYKEKILGGFSMGAVEACEHAMKHPVETLILCSMTPGIEHLRAIKAQRIIFFAGDKERWVIQDMKRLAKTLTRDWEICIIPNCDHKMNAKYIKAVLEVVERYSTVV